MDSYANIELLQLIDLIRGGENDAFDELVYRYTPMMNKVVSGFVNSYIRYDEAFAEACVALHRAVMSYDISRSADITFGLYARICVYRRLCDFVEKSMRQVPVVEMDVDLISTESNIEQQLVGREKMSEYLDKARGILSEYEYAVFNYYIDGYSTAEIAEKLGRDSKSVDNAKSRMLKRLREESDVFTDI